MPNFNEEVSKYTAGVNLLPTELANLFEKEMGIEVGTRRSLEIVRRALEHYLSQVTSALALLNEKEHLVAIRHLKTAEKWHQDALADVNRQLRTGDHLPG